MTLQYKFFTIPVRDIEASENELNKFLNSVRVVRVQKKFVEEEGGNSYWGISVEYMAKNRKTSDGKDRKPKIDYREVLSNEDFALFAEIRAWRKEVANKQGVMLYTIFNNEQLATIAEKRIMTKAGLKEINGIGEERVKKYGDAVIEIVSRFQTKKKAENETERPALPPDTNV